MTTVLPRVRTLRAVDVMSAPAITVSPDASPWDAWNTMVHHDIRHLIVAVDGHCIGTVHDREVFAQWPMGPLALRRTRIGSMMRHRVTCVVPMTELHHVAHVMITDRTDAVPVVDEAGELLGVVTAGDITAAVARCGIRDVDNADACD